MVKQRPQRRRCCIIGCPFWKDCKNKDVKVFRFPSDEKRCAEWLRVVGDEELCWIPTEKLHDLRYVCEKHFREEDILRYPRCIRLAEQAIPCFFQDSTRAFSQKVSSPSIPPKAILQNIEVGEGGSSLSNPLIVPPDSNGYVSAPQKLSDPKTNNYQFVLVESNVARDSENPDTSVCGDPPQMEEPEASYDEELLETVKDQLCRVCGMKQDNLLPLYSVAEAVEEDELTVGKKIELYLPLEINKEDGLPANICVDCCTRIESWHELHTTSVAADSILKKMYAARKKELAPLIVTENTRSDKENFLDDQVPDMMSSKNSHDSLNIQERSGLQLDCSDNVEEACRHLQSSYASIELEIKNLLRRLQEQLGKDLHYIVKETENNPPDSIRNDHMYALPTTCKYCRKVLSENALKSVSGDKQSCFCACNDDGAGNYKILDVFRELLEKAEEKIVKDCNDMKQADYFQDDHETLRESKILQQVYTCVHCKQTFSYKGTGLLHKRQCVLEPAMCEICGRIVKTRRKLKAHKARHGDETPSVCEKCGKIFTSTRGLKFHIQNLHTEGTFVCEPCLKVFCTRFRLKMHMKQHEKGKVKGLNLTIAESGLQGMLTCPVCEEQFQDKTSLIVHMNKRIKFKCVQCRMWILNERLFLTHKCSITTCRFCPKRFFASVGKCAHERIHTGEKPFVCKECGKAFRACCSLVKHRVTHKPPEYKCDICDKWFMRKSVYHDHMSFHAGIKHPCQFCNKVYNRRTALCKHNAEKHKDEMNSAKHKTEFIVIEGLG